MDIWGSVTNELRKNQADEAVVATSEEKRALNHVEPTKKMLANSHVQLLDASMHENHRKSHTR
jgi:hypothetical protein